MTSALLLLLAAGPRLDDTPPWDFRKDPSYQSPVPALENWLAQREKPPRGPQHFCAVGYRNADGATRAWIHWKEGRMLLLWEGTDPDYRPNALIISRRQLSFDTDVVPTEDDINGSTYLVSKAWVAERLDDCARYGFRYTVKARRAKEE